MTTIESRLQISLLKIQTWDIDTDKELWGRLQVHGELKDKKKTSESLTKEEETANQKNPDAVEYTSPSCAVFPLSGLIAPSSTSSAPPPPTVTFSLLPCTPSLTLEILPSNPHPPVSPPNNPNNPNNPTSTDSNQKPSSTPPPSTSPLSSFCLSLPPILPPSSLSPWAKSKKGKNKSKSKVGGKIGGDEQDCKGTMLVDREVVLGGGVKQAGGIISLAVSVSMLPLSPLLPSSPSVSPQEYISQSIIQDRPTNIDTFYRACVDVVFGSIKEVVGKLEGLSGKVEEGGSSREEILKAFSTEYRGFVQKGGKSQKEGGEERSQLLEVLQEYQQISFREFHAFIDEKYGYKDSVQVIEDELQCLKNILLKLLEKLPVVALESYSNALTCHRDHSKYLESLQSKISEMTSCRLLCNQGLQLELDLDFAKGHAKEAARMKKSLDFKEKIKEYRGDIVDINFWGKDPDNLDNFPIIFEDRVFRDRKAYQDYEDEKKKQEEVQEEPSKLTPTKKQVIFICHGISTSPADMGYLKLYLSQVMPSSEIIISKVNENKTSCYELDILGARFAEEVKENCDRLKLKGLGDDKESKDKENVESKEDWTSEYNLSFIGYCIGGLIIRSAIKYIPQYKDNFKSFLTISTPHIGILPEASKNIFDKGNLL